MHRDVITLVDEEGQTHDFRLVDVLEVGPHRYAILQPAHDEAAVVFRVEGDTLVVIEDTAEFTRVVDAIQASEEYDLTLLDSDLHAGRKDNTSGT